jgi:hypothetical protein
MSANRRVQYRGRVPMEATVANGFAVRADARRFHLWMSTVFLLIAFGGFIPTYWAKVASGTFHAPPIIHIHGMVLFTWTLFYFLQTAWVAAGRPAHRRRHSIRLAETRAAARRLCLGWTARGSQQHPDRAVLRHPGVDEHGKVSGEPGRLGEGSGTIRPRGRRGNNPGS